MLDYSEDPYRGKIVQTAPGEFKASPVMIKSVPAARAMYNKFRAGHLKRIALVTEIEGLIQGNPPYNPAELAAAGLQHVSNFNDMSARAVIERASLQYWNLLHNSQYLTNFALRTPDPDGPQYAEIMSKNWDYAIRSMWPSFDINVASLAMQLVKFGLAPVLFPDEKDFRWRLVEYHRFFVPDQAQADLDMLTTVMVETEFTVQYLWSVYEAFKKKEPAYEAYIHAEDVSNEQKNLNRKSPWDLVELGRMLVWLANSPSRDSVLPHDLFELERKLFSGDMSFDRMYNDTIRVVSLFQREYSGKVSHYMFHRHYDQGSFMFFEHEQYDSMNDAVVIFTMNPGEYTIHANKGIGHKIFSLGQAKIMADNSVVDMGKWASTPILKSPSLSTKDTDQIRYFPGVPVNIGNTEFVQNNMGANVQEVIGISQYLKGEIQYNISYSGADPASPDPDTGSISPSQARIMAFREFSVLKNQIMHFYATMDRVVRNMTAKMLRAKEGWPAYQVADFWKQRCIEDGVPEQVFEIRKSEQGLSTMPSTIDVSATRAAGAGSQVAHLISLQELSAIQGSFGPKAALAMKRHFISATIGPEYIDELTQDDQDPDEISGGASLAGVENAIMQNGMSPIFSPDNEHRAHFGAHMSLNVHIAQAVDQQQMSPMDADKIFGVSIPHTGQHLQALSQNPYARDFFAKSKPAFDQVQQYALLNRKNAQEQAEAQQKQQQEQQQRTEQVLNEEQLKNIQVQGDERRKDLKLSAQEQRQQQAGVAKSDALFSKVRGELAIKAAKSQGEVGVKRIDTIMKNKAASPQPIPSTDTGEDFLSGPNSETLTPFDFETPPSQ